MQLQSEPHLLARHGDALHTRTRPGVHLHGGGNRAVRGQKEKEESKGCACTRAKPPSPAIYSTSPTTQTIITIPPFSPSFPLMQLIPTKRSAITQVHADLYTLTLIASCWLAPWPSSNAVTSSAAQYIRVCAVLCSQAKALAVSCSIQQDHEVHAMPCEKFLGLATPQAPCCRCRCLRTGRRCAACA